MAYSNSQIFAIIWSWIEIVGFIASGIYSYTKYEKSKEVGQIIIDLAKDILNNENHFYVRLFDQKVKIQDFWLTCMVMSGIGVLSAFLLMFGVIKKIRPMLIPWLTTQFGFIVISILYIVYNGPETLYIAPAVLGVMWFFMQGVSANLYHRERIIRQYDPKSVC